MALVVSCSAGTHNCGHQRSRLRTQSPGNGVSHHNNKKAQFCLYVYSCLQTDTEEGNLNWYVKWVSWELDWLFRSHVLAKAMLSPLVSEGGFPEANNVCRIILWNVFSFHICRLPIELFQSNLYPETFPQKYSDAGAKSDWLNSPNQSVRTWEHVQFIVFRNYFAQYSCHCASLLVLFFKPESDHCIVYLFH